MGSNSEGLASPESFLFTQNAARAATTAPGYSLQKTNRHSDLKKTLGRSSDDANLRSPPGRSPRILRYEVVKKVGFLHNNFGRTFPVLPSLACVLFSGT